MFKNLMKIAWLGLLGSYTAIWITLRREVALTDSYEWVAWLGMLGFVFWIYLAARLFVLRRKFNWFSGHILDGNYETGLKPSRFLLDEVHTLEKLINRMTDRLRIFDALRAEKVALSTRAREIIHERSCEAVVIADLDAAAFLFNKESRALFGIEQEEVTLDSIEKRPENAQFAEFFRKTVDRDKVPHEARLTITPPGRSVTRDVAAEIIPVKDREEKVRLALIFLR